MTRTSQKILAISIACIILCAGSVALAQFTPPLDAMDTLSGAPTGGPGAAARPAAPAAGAQPPPGGQYMDPTMMMMMMGGGAAPGAAVGTPTPTPTPTPRRYPAIQGQRIYDAVSYRRNRQNPIILDDVRRIEIGEEDLDRFSDDGKTLGDFEAGDGIYSQILPPSYNEYIGGRTNFYLQRIIVMLRNAEELNPLDFFGIYAMTIDRFSDIPHVRDKISEQVAKIAVIDEEADEVRFGGWAQSFLADYRLDSSNPMSEFFPLYVPRYPEPPSSEPLPAPWRPYGAPDLMDVAAGGPIRGRMGPGGAMDPQMMMMMGGGMPPR